MTDATIAVNTGTGPLVDMSSLTVGSNTVERQRINIADPTSATGIAAVKNASTAATATDPALVVTVSPNNIVFIQGYQPAATTGSITSATTVVGPITMQGINIATVAVYGTYTGVTFIFEASTDNTNWFIVQGSRVDNSLVGTGLIAGSSANIAWDIPVGAWNFFRVRATAWTSGTASIIIGSQSLPYDPAPAALTQGLIQPGSALPASPSIAPVIMGASDGANARTLLSDAGGRLLVVGDLAAGVTDANNPQKIGGQARITNPTAVADGQRVSAIFDKLGKQIVVGAVRDLKARQRTNIAASTAETTIVAAIAATFNDLYGLVITNNGAATMSVTIRDATAGTPVAVFEVPATDTRGLMLPVDSAIPQTTVNNNWTATCTPNATSVDITALYVKNV